MPGTTNHERQYTSTYYTPFRYYSTTNGLTIENAPIIDFSQSESANNNEILVIPFKAASITPIDNDTLLAENTYAATDDGVAIDVYALINLQTAQDVYSSNPDITKPTWCKISSIICKEGQISSIAPLFATYYKLVSQASDYILNVSNNDVDKNGGHPYIIKQTYPKESWGSVLNKDMFEVETKPGYVSLSSKDLVRLPKQN